MCDPLNGTSYLYRNDPSDDGNGLPNDCSCEPEEIVCQEVSVVGGTVEEGERDFSNSRQDQTGVKSST